MTDTPFVVHRVAPAREVLTPAQCERIFKAKDHFNSPAPDDKSSHHLADLLDLIDELVPRDVSDALDFDYVFWQAGARPYEDASSPPAQTWYPAPGTGAR